MLRHTAGMLALAVFVAWLSGSAGAQGDKASELRATMKKIGDGSSGLYTKLGRELRDEEPAWDDARKMSRELVLLSAGLGKHTPPRGDKTSWETKTKAFTETVAALDQAVGKRDRATAFASWKRMEEQTCAACHKVHRKE